MRRILCQTGKLLLMVRARAFVLYKAKDRRCCPGSRNHGHLALSDTLPLPWASRRRPKTDHNADFACQLQRHNNSLFQLLGCGATPWRYPAVHYPLVG